MSGTVVHVVRHGQVFNPEHVLYGRLPGFGLSELGMQMACATGEYLRNFPIGHLRCSPLLRTRQTMSQIAKYHEHLPVVYDDRMIEADNLFSGGKVGARLLLQADTWRRIRAPWKPSWGEAYPLVVERMKAAVQDAASECPAGKQAVLVSHELVIWAFRMYVEGKCVAVRTLRRECTLASVTSFVLNGEDIRLLGYAEPAGHLLPK